MGTEGKEWPIFQGSNTKAKIWRMNKFSPGRWGEGEYGQGNNKEQRYENVLQSVSSSVRLICSVEC